MRLMHMGLVQWGQCSLGLQMLGYNSLRLREWGHSRLGPWVVRPRQKRPNTTEAQTNHEAQHHQSPPTDAWFLKIVPIMRHLQIFWNGNGLWVVGYFLNSCNILEMWNWKQMCTYVVSNYIILIICSMLSFDLHTSKFEWYWGKSCT